MQITRVRFAQRSARAGCWVVGVGCWALVSILREMKYLSLQKRRRAVRGLREDKRKKFPLHPFLYHDIQTITFLKAGKTSGKTVKKHQKNV
jgi:hypothetical protein